MGAFFLQTSDDIYLQPEIEKMATRAIIEADVVVLLVDYKDGQNAMDNAIAGVLRKFSDKVVLAVNKVDDLDNRYDVGAFQPLGFTTILTISGLHGSGVGDLMDRVTEKLPHPRDAEEIPEDVYKIAIVGRPNVGKSSLMNAILNEDRVIVDNQAGTTRDAVEVFFEYQDHKYIFVDTAGMKRLPKVKGKIDYYAWVRANRVIQEVDLVVVVLESDQLLTDQDKKIINAVMAAKRNMMIFVNKWDLTPRTSAVQKDLERILINEMPPLEFYPLLFGSATEKVGLGKIFNTAPQIIAEGEKRVSTSKLNQFIEDVIMKNPPPARKGKRIKIYYATQAEISPPTFIFFINDAKLIEPEYKRFLERRIRHYLGGFRGNTIQLFFRSKPKR